jgi:hypothetical protein
MKVSGSKSRGGSCFTELEAADLSTGFNGMSCRKYIAWLSRFPLFYGAPISIANNISNLKIFRQVKNVKRLISQT